MIRAQAGRARRCGDLLSWGVAEASCPDEQESGDRYVVQPSADGVLIAALDGTGHGAEAAKAARIAVATLEAFARESPAALVSRCHEQLRGTRGAVMTLAFVDRLGRMLTWLGVGNVEGILFHGDRPDEAAPDRALLRGGIMGYQIPALRAEVVAVKPRDTLVMATDGISPEFDEWPALEADPQNMADEILARHWKGMDDGLVIVARYLGGEQL
jgi:phosphoserine phosphatase RsbX